VAIYRYTKGPLGPAHAVLIPLALAALMFGVGAVLMWRLERDRRARPAGAIAVAPEPGPVTAAIET